MRSPRSLITADVASLRPGPDLPLYLRIEDRLRSAIRVGSLGPGARLPAARTLARDFGVARNTVEAALNQLVDEGYVVRRQGAGSFVAAVLPARDAPARPILLSAANAAAPTRLSRYATELAACPAHRGASLGRPFTPSMPALDLFPRNAWLRVSDKVGRAAGPDNWAFGASSGLPELRRAIAAQAAAARGMNCSADQVVVLTSTQQGIDLAARVLADPGDGAWIEDPCYPPARLALVGAGLKVARVPVDEDGIDVAAGCAMAPDARLAYVTPSHQYPLGYEMSAERRRALLDWARRADAYLIEDDYDGDYRYCGRAMEPLKASDRDQRVIYIGSFNKTMFPGLRIAFAIVPDALLDAFINIKHVADGHNATQAQAALAEFILEGHYAVHLRRTRAIYDERRLTFLELAGQVGGLTLGPAEAGMHVAGRLAPWADEQAIAERCLRAGVDVHPLSRYGRTRWRGLVFGFACCSPGRMPAAMDVVARAIAAEAAPSAVG